MGFPFLSSCSRKFIPDKLFCCKKVGEVAVVAGKDTIGTVKACVASVTVEEVVDLATSVG